MKAYVGDYVDIDGDGDYVKIVDEIEYGFGEGTTYILENSREINEKDIHIDNLKLESEVIL